MTFKEQNEITRKLVELKTENNTLKEMIIAKNKECELKHGLLLAVGMTDVEMNMYTLDQIWFLARNYAEAIERYEVTGIRLLEAIRKDYILAHSVSKTGFAPRNFKEIDEWTR